MKRCLWVLVLALGCGWGAWCSGEVRYVSAASGVDVGTATNPATPCRTIQFAVDQASAGDEIRIATFDIAAMGLSNECVYTGTGSNVITMTKGLRLRGGYVYTHLLGANWNIGPVPARVEGEGARRPLYIHTGGDITNHIELLALDNGQAERGGNAYVEGGQARFVGVPIHGGAATYGGGLYLKNAGFSFATGGVNGINLPMLSGLMLIYSNHATHGGGMFVEGGSPVLTTLGLWNNTADLDGGACYVEGGAPTLMAGTLLENQAGRNGGGVFLHNSRARIAVMNLSSNRASQGGGIYLDGPFAFAVEAVPLIVNCQLRYNAATNQAGGALYFQQAMAGLVNNVIANNTAQDGAAAYLWASSPAWYFNTVADNVGGSGFYLTHKPGQPWPPVAPIPSWPMFTNNIIVGHATGLWVNTTGYPLPFQNKATMGYTLWWSNAADYAGSGTVLHEDDLNANPLFTCTGWPPDCPRPYHLETNSPAVDAGGLVELTIPGTDLMVDIDGDLRPFGAGYDIGADEVVFTGERSTWLLPPLLAAMVRPGQIVTNTHLLVNSSTLEDDYAISISSIFSWPAQITPTSVVLSAQTWTTLVVRIEIPADVEQDDQDFFVVSADSTNGEGFQATAAEVCIVDTNDPGPVTRYVWQESPAPGAPYTSWDTAGHVIQSVADVAAAGDTILVTDGLYAEGGKPVPGYALTNRVCLTNAVTLQSVNGPAHTILQGHFSPEGGHGDDAMRCVYLAGGAYLSGFTLTGGATRATMDAEGSGAGAYAEGAAISNCVFSFNSAQSGGGGVFGGEITHSSFTGNWGMFGGAAEVATLRACQLVMNWSQNGGGANNCALYNCLVFTNAASVAGGGVFGGFLDNCTVSDNAAGLGGGAAHVVARNSILYYNGPNEDTYASTGFNCCISTLPEYGSQNMTNAPLFADRPAGNFRLQGTSPCVDAGDNAHAAGASDLDGNPRIQGQNGTVDMGAYEFYRSAQLPAAWQILYGFPTNGCLDYWDMDGDYTPNWEEQYAGTIPTDSNSVFRATRTEQTEPEGFIIAWASEPAHSYAIHCSTNLPEHAWTLFTNQIPATPPLNVVTDRTVRAGSTWLYRVEAE